MWLLDNSHILERSICARTSFFSTLKMLEGNFARESVDRHLLILRMIITTKTLELTKVGRLDGYNEQESLDQLLVAVPYRDFRHLSNFSDFPLGFSFSSQDRRNVAGGCGYAGGAPP